MMVVLRPYGRLLASRSSIIKNAFIRQNSTKTQDPSILGQTPFSESSLKGDEQYNELNEFYSDLFTTKDGEKSQLNTSANNTNELEEINSELKELYGIDTLTEPSELEIHEPLKEPTLPLHSVSIQKEESSPSKLNLLQKIKENKPLVFISNSNSPYQNLAFEDYIFTHTPFSKSSQFNAHRLIFYVNTPCVIIGKNQNPWNEANVPILNKLGIPLIRRKSGGGTVVHDLHNVNYSYISTRNEFNRSFFGSIIVKGLNEAGILNESLKQNERGDIITSIGERKVSGSAFKISKGKSYHHGTMLLNSKLDILRALLSKKGKENLEYKSNGVASVSSKVTNIEIENDEFIGLVTEGFKNLYPNQSVEVIECDTEDLIEVEEINDISDELQSWEWNYGKTPEFDVVFNRDDFNLTMKVSKGYLKDFTVDDVTFLETFKFLRQALKQGNSIQFRGSEIAGFILDDELSEWIGNSIDGTS